MYDMAYDVQMKMVDRAWQLSLMTVPLDNFDIILGKLHESLGGFDASSWGSVLGESKPCFVLAISGDKRRGRMEMVSAL